jgi:hypothetical protein
MPTDILALPASSLNTKWKEPYASASLNQRFVGITAPGIYRGLGLNPDPSLGDRTIQIQADQDNLDHVAVYENSNGFSVTYRDSVSGDITLSLAVYSNINVIICVFVDYQAGSSTTGAFRIFTEAEFNGLLPVVRDALVILGTVVVPVSGVISAGNISFLRRTLASRSLPRGTIPNAPLVRNSGFESGETNATYAKSSLFWDKSMTVGTGTWKTVATPVASGMKSIELSVTAGPVTGEISQQVGVETAEGELFPVSVSIKQIKTISSGSLSFFMEWSDVNDAILSTTLITLDGGGIDSSFRTVESIIAAPAGAASLRAVGVRATALSPSSTGVFGYIDNVDVLVEPKDTQHPYPFDQAFRRSLRSPALVLADATGGFSDLAASIRFDRTTPASEGSVFVERVDQNYSGANLPPMLDLQGRASFGSQLLSNATRALSARIATPHSGTHAYTLLWSSIKDAAGASIRVYADPLGRRVITVNASYNGANWAADDVANSATRQIQLRTGWKFEHRLNTAAPWSDASWMTSVDIAGSPSTASVLGGQLSVPRTGISADSGVYVCPDGRLVMPYRNIRYDAITFDTANSIGFWGATDNFNSGVVFLGNNDGEAFLNFQTIASSGSRACARMRGGSGGTTGRSAFPVTTRPGFTIKFRMTGSLLTRYDYFGFTDGGNLTDGFNSPMCTVIRNTTLGTSFRVHYEDTTNAEFTFDTGFSPTLDVWYYMTLIVISQSPGSFLFRIGTTPDWKSTDTISYQTALSGNGDLQPDDSGFNWRWGTGVRTTGASLKQLELSWVDVFATKEWA